MSITIEEIKFLIKYQRIVCEALNDDKSYSALCYLLGIENALGGVSKETVEENVSKIMM